MSMKVVHMFYFLFLAVGTAPLFSDMYTYKKVEASRAFVSAQPGGRLGNMLFQVSTACALAWDHNATPCFPKLDLNDPVVQHIFSRVQKQFPKNRKVLFRYDEPVFSYVPIPYCPCLEIQGYFQSEKYFNRYRSLLMDLYAPLPEDLRYMTSKYGWLMQSSNTVGIQVRNYKSEGAGSLYPQYGKEYVEKAMALFPASSLFVVSSNDLNYAKKCIPAWAKNVWFIEDEPNYIDLYLLSFCKDNIITNSTFGWWAAWLNKNPNKKVVRPAFFLNGLPYQDLCPESWIALDAPWD